MENIISIDVEDWFHILEIESVSDIYKWENIESRIERNFMMMMSILEEKNIKTTCFFLGWIAEKYPNLVQEAYKNGHEIASHGFAHKLIFNQTQKQFFEDVYKTKQILEDIVSIEVIGYRAPGFSIVPETIWAFSNLAKAGYKYDSSLFPAKRGHGYYLEANLRPFKIRELDFYEFPITVIPLLLNNICFFGGGYLRLFPYWLINIMERIVEKDNRPIIYYIHPREIDIDQPKLNMSKIRKFKSYTNLKTVEKKLNKIIAKNKYLSFSKYLKKYGKYFNEIDYLV